jgi:hypothetical protein
MPLSKRISLPHGATVAVWQLTEDDATLAAQLEHPELFASKIRGLRSGSRRLQEILAVRCLLKQLHDGRELEILYSSDGKPFVTDHSELLSITHTEGYAAVLCVPVSSAGTLRPGIDIEHLGHRVARVAPRFLIPSEQQLLADSETAVRRLVATVSASGTDAHDAAAQEIDPITIHLAWSAKETAFKVLDSSFYDLQNKTTITDVDPVDHSLKIKAVGISRPLQITFEVTNDYVLTYTLHSETAEA